MSFASSVLLLSRIGFSGIAPISAVRLPFCWIIGTRPTVATVWSDLIAQRTSRSSWRPAITDERIAAEQSCYKARATQHGWREAEMNHSSLAVVAPPPPPDCNSTMWHILGSVSWTKHCNGGADVMCGLQENLRTPLVPFVHYKTVESCWKCRVSDFFYVIMHPLHLCWSLFYSKKQMSLVSSSMDDLCLHSTTTVLNLALKLNHISGCFFLGKNLYKTLK